MRPRENPITGGLARSFGAPCAATDGVYSPGSLDHSPSVLDLLPTDQPPLARAVTSSRAAASLGFDWPGVPPVVQAVRDELSELDDARVAGRADELHHELGDVLLATCNLARHLGVDPTAALSDAVDRFERRFRRVEAGVRAEGLRWDSLSPDELERRWQDAKRTLAAEDAR